MFWLGGGGGWVRSLQDPLFTSRGRFKSLLPPCTSCVLLGSGRQEQHRYPGLLQNVQTKHRTVTGKSHPFLFPELHAVKPVGCICPDIFPTRSHS